MSGLSWTGCVSPKSICGSPHPQCDGVRRWGFGEVIRVGWGHEGGGLMNGTSAFIRRDQGGVSSLSLSPCHMRAQQKGSHP